jgi:hypothetical protein
VDILKYSGKIVVAHPATSIPVGAKAVFIPVISRVEEAKGKALTAVVYSTIRQPWCRRLRQ